MYRQQNSENILKFRFSFVQSCDMMMLVFQSVSENCFPSDVRHSLWEIRSEWGRRSGLRWPNEGQISCKVGRADDGNEFSDTL